MGYGVEAFGGGPTDTAAPEVTNVTPAPGVPINPTDEVRFDVVDDSGEFAALLITVDQRGVGEVVHDGERFVGYYGALSTRELVANGYRYRVRRSGGWTATPIFRIYAVDSVGNTL
jgi:hypothetical protein